MGPSNVGSNRDCEFDAELEEDQRLHDEISVMPVTVLGVHTPNGDLDDDHESSSFDVSKVVHHHSKVKSSRSKPKKNNHHVNGNSNINGHNYDNFSGRSHKPSLSPCETRADIHKNASCDQYGKCDISCNFCECVITCNPECENKNGFKSEENSCKCQLHVHRVCEARTRYMNIRQQCKCQKTDTKDLNKFLSDFRSSSPPRSDSKSSNQRLSSPCSSSSSCSTPLVAITTFGKLHDPYSGSNGYTNGGNSGILINGTTVVTPPPQLQQSKAKDMLVPSSAKICNLVCKNRKRNDWYKRENNSTGFIPVETDGSLWQGPYDDYERLSPLPLQHTPPPILSYPSGNIQLHHISS